jgi:hypothetical protein
VPGMKSGFSDTNPVIVAAFNAALLHQGLIIAAVLVLLALAWATVRARGFRRRGAVSSVPPPREFTARRILRIGFGILWVLDGLLQAQPAMAAGLPSQVMEPGAACPGRRDGGAQRRGLRYQPERAHQVGAQLRPGSRHVQLAVVVRRRTGRQRAAGPGAGIPTRRESRRGQRGAAVVALTATGLLSLAACAASRPPAEAAGTAGGRAAVRSGPALATSLAGSDGTSWAVVEMGATASPLNSFWELFVRPAGGFSHRRCAAGTRGRPRNHDRLAAWHPRLDAGSDRPGADPYGASG